MDGRPSGSIFPPSPFSKRVRKPKTRQEQRLSKGMSASCRTWASRALLTLCSISGAFMVWAIASDRRPFLPGVPIMQDKEIPDRFGQDFTLEHVQNGEGRWMANWYTLRRR